MCCMRATHCEFGGTLFLLQANRCGSVTIRIYQSLLYYIGTLLGRCHLKECLNIQIVLDCGSGESDRSNGKNNDSEAGSNFCVVCVQHDVRVLEHCFWFKIIAVVALSLGVKHLLW